MPITIKHHIMSPSSLTIYSSIKTIFRGFDKSKLDISTDFIQNIDNIVFICWEAEIYYIYIYHMAIFHLHVERRHQGTPSLY